MPGDGNGVRDIFVRDLELGVTTRVSVDSAGGDANGPSGGDGLGPARVSDDGRIVVFASAATDLVPGQPGRVFVRDLEAGTTVALPANRVLGLSADGSAVLYQPSFGEAGLALYLVDAGTSAPASLSVGGDVVSSAQGALSSSGRYVAYQATDTAVLGHGDGEDVVFVRDLLTGDITAGTPAGAGAFNPFVSDDGSRVFFGSEADDLVPGDTNGWLDLFVHDIPTGRTTRVDAGILAQQQVFGVSLLGAMSGDGRYASFATIEPLDPTATGDADVYVRATFPPAVTAVSPSVLPIGVPTEVTITGTDFAAGAALGGLTGVTVGPVDVVSPTELSVTLTARPDADLDPRNLGVLVPGPGPGVIDGSVGLCVGCVTVTAAGG